MIIFLLTCLGAVLFVVGISFILKGYMGIKKVAFAGKKDAEKIQQELDKARGEENQLKLQLDKLTLDLTSAKEASEKVQGLQGTVSVLEKEESEIKAQVNVLERKLQFLSEAADRQAKEAIEIIGDLDTENETVRMEGSKPGLTEEQEQEFKEKMQALENDLNFILQKADVQAREAKEIIEQLDKEKREMSESFNEAEKAKGLVEVLEKENQDLEEGIRQITTKIKDAEAEVSSLGTQGEEGLEEARQTIRRLEEEVRVLQAQIQQNDTTVKALEDDLREKKEELNQASPGFAETKNENLTLKEELNKSAETEQEKELLAQQQKQWAQEKEEFEKAIIGLKNVNTRLVEREKLIQLELTKNRVQIMGLKKAYEGIKQNYHMQKNQQGGF